MLICNSIERKGKTSSSERNPLDLWLEGCRFKSEIGRSIVDLCVVPDLIGGVSRRCHRVGYEACFVWQVGCKLIRWQALPGLSGVSTAVTRAVLARNTKPFYFYRGQTESKMKHTYCGPSLEIKVQSGAKQKLPSLQLAKSHGWTTFSCTSEPLRKTMALLLMLLLMTSQVCMENVAPQVRIALIS